MSEILSTITEPIFERTTRILTATIEDPDGDGFKPETLTLLLYDVESGSIINSRNRVNILDANGGTVSVDGEVELMLTHLDNVILNPRTGKTQEVHRALLEWTWASGTKYGKHEVEFTVDDNSQVS